jgi:3-methyladenine DNA glycosylase/8-oxoguanine DNA glycosylase
MTVETVWRPALAVDVRRTLWPLQRGRYDPTHHLTAEGLLWRTTLTPDGPASLVLTQRGAREVHAQAWGPGAAWVLENVPDLLGRRDHLDGFDPQHPLLVATHRLHPGLRIPRTNRVFESLAPAILEQKVTGKEARAAFRRLVLAYGEPAPGPVPEGLRVPPSPETWRRIPSWDWHRAAVDPQRSRTLITAARLAGRLEEAVSLEPAAALVRLRAVPGVGEWTAAEVALRALGDADALSVGDYHLSQLVGWALTGSPLDDAGMVALLEPWRPHRGRVVRLIELSGVSKPTFGPRRTIQDHRAV